MIYEDILKRLRRSEGEGCWECTLGDLVALLNGHRGHIDNEGITK